jgi:hypothetical protein
VSPLHWLLSSRASGSLVRPKLPTYALDAVTVALAHAGYEVVAEPVAAQAHGYRVAATTDRTLRFVPIVPPKRTDLIHAVTVRQRDDRVLRVTATFGARKIQVVGVLLMLAAGAGAWWLWTGAWFGGLSLLFLYPFVYGILCVTMPMMTNADAVKGLIAKLQGALFAEEVRAVDSVRRRVASPAGPRVAASPAGSEAEQEPEAENVADERKEL